MFDCPPCSLIPRLGAIKRILTLMEAGVWESVLATRDVIITSTDELAPGRSCRKAEKVILKGALRSFGKEIQAQKGDTCRINKVIIQLRNIYAVNVFP